MAFQQRPKSQTKDIHVFSCLGGARVMGHQHLEQTFLKKVAFPRGQKVGVGQNLTRRPPTENSFRPPSPRYVLPPPPYPISLIKSLRNPQNFPQVTSSETIFRRVSKSGFQGAILPRLARFCFSARLEKTPSLA